MQKLSEVTIPIEEDKLQFVETANLNNFVVQTSRGGTISVQMGENSENKEICLIKEQDQWDKQQAKKEYNKPAQEEKEKRLESFKEQRLAILDLKSLFFYHYAQVISSIKAECTSRSPQNPDINIQKLNEIFTGFIENKAFNKDIDDEFMSCLSSPDVIKSDGTIDVEQLNIRLNKAIKPLKKILDEQLKTQLDNEKYTVQDKKFREATNAFNANVMVEATNNANITFKSISSTVTAHGAKSSGPAVTKVTLTKNLGQERQPQKLFTAYRTSHLVSKPTKSKYRPYIMGAIAVVGIISLIAFPPLGIPVVAAIGIPVIATAVTALIKISVTYGAIVGAGKASDTYLSQSKEEKANIDNTKNIIAYFMQNAPDDKSKPMIYNLLTSTHARGISPMDINDSLTNMQTGRLRTLINAQTAYNMQRLEESKNLVNNQVMESFPLEKMFFTFNTPTNTFGQDIRLKTFKGYLYDDKEMLQVAQSNTIALAILLFGHDNEQVKKMAANAIKEDGEYSAFETARLELIADAKNMLGKTGESLSDHQQLARQFLLARFIDDSAATKEWAKESATCIGVLSKDKANLIFGCKSGNERTGGILGRIETFLSMEHNKMPTLTTNEPNQPLTTKEILKFSSDFKKTLSEEYNKSCFRLSTVIISLIDQGSYPKISKKLGQLSDCMNTNLTEMKEYMKNFITSGVGQLQAHKDKAFSGSSVSSWQKFKNLFEGQKRSSNTENNAQLESQEENNIAKDTKNNISSKY